ncbi:hypothetical protein GYH30_017599 [Glycine max]|nr:hypothetical protein GYH30_017599 [Glycine max]
MREFMNRLWCIIRRIMLRIFIKAECCLIWNHAQCPSRI